MQTDGRIIYVAGTPDLYPIEYYDSENQAYQGAIPEFLAAFAQAYGYDLQYFQPGTEDRRAELAENQQVDLISGCEAEDWYAHTVREPLTLFTSQADGEETAYALFLTEVAPSQFQTDLREYVARTSQTEWTGAVLQSAGEVPSQQIPTGLLWGAGGIVLALLIALTVTLVRLRREKRKKAQVSQSDPETGLGTEKVLEEAFLRLIDSQSRNAYSLVCVHLELDRIGRLWGYERAKALLSHGAQVLCQAAGPGDVLARYGDDLLALKRAVVSQEAVQWADEAVQQIRSTFEGCLCPQDAAASIYPLAEAPHDLAHAMFHTKQCARTACWQGQTTRVCGMEQHPHCLERWNLLEDFFKAQKQNEFQLYIQFFVDADTFQIVGGEVLSRWYHPRFGLLSPGRYIPLLEETGQIADLDFYGLERACAFLEELGRAQIQDFFISCNFARKTFCASDFAQQCVQVVQRHDFPRKLLILEVTESQQMERGEMEQLCRNIQEVRESGMRVIFDDFGVGFSSFHDLQNCPMDGLKLDKELVDNMQTEKGKIILNALVETGHRMGLTILAEGVEEERQIKTLQRLHCDVFQGFRFAVPLPEEEARRRILNGERSLKDLAYNNEENCHGRTECFADCGR